MPPVVAVVAAIGSAVAGVAGIAVAAGSLTAFAVGAATIIGGALAIKSLIPKIDMGQIDNDQSRQQTVRGTIEPHKIIYGETLVSGPVAFVGVSGTENRDLHHVVVLAGHEVDAITDIHFDSQIITDAQITGNNVTSGTFGPINATTICQIAKYLGTSTQSSDAVLTSVYPGYTSSHQGRGLAYIRTTYSLIDDSEELWDKYVPQAIKAVVRGKKIYDPRLDITPGSDPTNAAYIAWSDNPALCVADYLIDTKHGMAIPAAKLDWSAVVTAANECDELVTIPGGTEKRFTCNGVLYGTDPHRASINKLLSSMNGTLVYSGGIYTIRAGVYEAPVETLTENDLAGKITVKTSVDRADRFNTVTGIFIDPAQEYKSSEFSRVFTTAARLRDNGEILEREIELPFTSTNYMAQRIAFKQVQMSDQQKLVTFPANLAGLRVAVGDRVALDIDEFGWSGKVFRCVSWSFGDDAGVNLTLIEDDAGSYADPLLSEYSTVTADGVISEGFRGVPDPQNLTAVAGIKSIELDWDNPTNMQNINNIAVYASPTSAWASAVKIGQTLGTSFVHNGGTSADPIADGDTRFYWIRALSYGSDTQAVSDRNPDNDVSTISATAALNQAQLVEWAAVADGSGLRPENNATVGAQLSVNVQNEAGGTLGDNDVLNAVVIQEITELELAGTNEVLELVGGLPAQLQQLGDVALYAYNSDQILDGYINTLNTSVGNIQNTLTDITAGVADVYVQTTAPVAGVGGVPDPIADNSRWYDSDDDNRPYYFNGTIWVDLSDPRIASNEAEISAVSASLTTTANTVSGHTTDISANTSAISVLDSTVTTIDGDLTALTGSYDAFVAQYVVEDATAATVANTSAIDALDIRVTSNEGNISTSATDITTLNSEIQFYTKLEGTDGNPLEFVGGGEIELQDTSSVGGAVANATNALDSRVVQTEAGLIAQASDITALDARVTTAEGNVAAESTALSGLTTIVESQGDILTASAADIVSLTATVDSNQTASASADSALDVRVTSAEGTISSQGSLITGLQAELDASQLDISGNASAVSAVEVRVTSAEGSISSQATDISTLQSSLTTTDGNVAGNSSAISAIDTRVTSAEGTITSQGSSISSLTASLGTTDTNVSNNASSISAIDVRVTSAEGSITSQASSISSLNTTVGNNSTTISTQQSSINGIEANYAVKVDSNGRVTGFGFNSTSATATPTSEFYVIADRFAVVDPLSTASAPIVPFLISGGQIIMSGDVSINGNLLVGGSVSTGQIGSNAITSDKIATALQSDNFVAGSDGWRIQKSGAAEFNGPVISRQILVDSGSYAFGTSTNSRYTSITETLSQFITTNLAFSAWNGTSKSYVVSVGVGGSITANSSDVSGEPQNILWGFTGEIYPLTAWSGGQNVRILLKYFTQKTVGYTNLVANWKIYEVT